MVGRLVDCIEVSYSCPLSPLSTSPLSPISSPTPLNPLSLRNP